VSDPARLRRSPAGSLAVLAAVTGAALPIACGTGSGKTPAAPERQELRIYNWADYMMPTRHSRPK